MADQSKIEWTDATWQPVTGCSIVSPGCTNCYAMKLAGTRIRHHPSRQGLTIESKAGPVWNGKVRFNEQWLTQPLRWKSPRRIFVCAHGDLFHESVPDEWIDKVFAVMALCPQHTFQVLTKRSARMREYMAQMTRQEWWKARIYEHAGEIAGWGKARPSVFPDWPLPNVWLGVSTERQDEADERIPHLLATPAAVRFISAEPLLGPIDLMNFRPGGGHLNALTGKHTAAPAVFGSAVNPVPRLDWVIAGGESGSGARPMHPDWARWLRDQCAAAGVPFFFKQWGEWAEWSDAEFSSEEAESLELQNRYEYFQRSSTDEPTHMRRIGKKRAGRLLDGVEHNGMPDCEARPA